MANKKRKGNGPQGNTASVMIRCTDAQRKHFEKLAREHGLSTSAWARMVLVREISGGKYAAPRDV